MANSKWTWIAIGYQCGLAYFVSFIIYQFGHIFVEHAPIAFSTFIAGFVLVGMVYSLIRNPKEHTQLLPSPILKEGK
jgi:ferrous iron transport protein B